MRQCIILLRVLAAAEAMLYCGGPAQRSHILLDLEARSFFKATRRALNLKRGPGKSGAAGRLTPGNQSKGKGNATTKEDEQNRWRKASKKEKRKAKSLVMARGTEASSCTDPF